MMDRVETMPADVRCSGLSPLEPDMEPCSAGSTKNLKHDEEKPHAAGSKKTEKKRKKVVKKLKDDEKEPHAAGPKKKKKRCCRIARWKEEPAWKLLEKRLQVKEEPEEKLRTVEFNLTMVHLKHLEEYIPSPPYGCSDWTSSDRRYMMNPYMMNHVKRATARHEAWLERRRRAVQQLKETGVAEIEIELLDDLEEDKNFAEFEKLMVGDLEE